MDAIGSKIIADFGEIVDAHGTSVTVYLDPTQTLDDEGGETITLGTGTDTKALIFTEKEETFTEESEGIDDTVQWAAYFKDSVGTIAEDTIILYNSEYYKIIQINRNPIEDKTVTFWGIVMERLKNQSSVS